MADIDVSSGDSGHKKGPGVKKAKKLSTRVDMTPMVDLGFLLITFFIFTTTMTEPNTMGLAMPKDDVDEDKKTEVKESGALTILLGRGNSVFYYAGQLEDGGANIQPSTFTDIRKVIVDKKKQVIANHVHNDACEDIRKKARERIPPEPDPQNACLDRDFMVVIKPNEEATYKNTIDMLDEMTISHVKRFAVIDITPAENEVIKR